MEMRYIYALCDPVTQAVRYVGKAKNTHRRLNAHLNETGVTRKCRWVASLQFAGLVPLLKVLEVVPVDDWQIAERKWIAHYRSLGENLTNHTNGGDGVDGLDDEARGRLSVIMSARLADPEIRKRILTPERSAKISMALSGMAKSKEHVAKLRQNHSGWHHSPSAIAKISKNNRGHRWSADEILVLREQNRGNKYGLGNKSLTGQHLSVEARSKISEFHSGKPKTAIQRLRMAEARRRWWAEKKGLV